MDGRSGEIASEAQAANKEAALPWFKRLSRPILFLTISLALVGAYLAFSIPVAVFPNTFISEGQPPRQWAERLYDIHRWTVMPSGGHFAPAEEPELLAGDIAAFFATIGR